MKIKSELNERRSAELKANEEKQHAEEVSILKNKNSQLNVIFVVVANIQMIFIVNFDFFFSCRHNLRELLRLKNNF